MICKWERPLQIPVSFPSLTFAGCFVPQVATGAVGLWQSMSLIVGSLAAEPFTGGASTITLGIGTYEFLTSFMLLGSACK